MLTSKSMLFNGEYIEDLIPGYTTLDVAGRESLEVEQKNSVMGNTISGENFRYKKYKGRSLNISFSIEGASTSELLEKLNHLNNILDQDEAYMIFRDEADKYYVGTRNGAPSISISNFMNGSLATGTFEMYCSDPFKYSVAWRSASPTVDNDSTILLQYNGTTPANPTLQVVFADAKPGGSYIEDGECGYVAFSDAEGNILQFGNPDEEDATTEQVTNETLINQTFGDISSWSTNSHNAYLFSDDYVKTGSFSVGSYTDNNWGKTWANNAISPSGFGIDTNTDVWRGPAITLIPVDSQSKPGANNFMFSCNLLMYRNSDTREKFMVQISLANPEGTNVAGVKIKKDTGSDLGTVEYYVDNELKESVNIDLSPFNTNFGKCNKIAYTERVGTTYYYTKKNGKGQKSSTKKGKYKYKYTTYKNVTKYNYTYPKFTCSISRKDKKLIFNIGNLASKEYISNVDYIHCTSSSTFRSTEQYYIKSGTSYVPSTPTETQFNANKTSYYVAPNAHIITLWAGAYSSSVDPYSSTGVMKFFDVKFTRDSAESFKDIKNVFQPGDVMTADVGTAEIYLRQSVPSGEPTSAIDFVQCSESTLFDSTQLYYTYDKSTETYIVCNPQPTQEEYDLKRTSYYISALMIPEDPSERGDRKPQLGAYGNDWESFKLYPGTNQINVQHSSWVNENYKPTFKVWWREAFL